MGTSPAYDVVEFARGVVPSRNMLREDQRKKSGGSRSSSSCSGLAAVLLLVVMGNFYLLLQSLLVYIDSMHRTERVFNLL